MPNPVTDYEALIDAAVAAPSRANAQAVRTAFDPFVTDLLAHLTSHLVKHLDAAEAEEMLKPVGDRNQAALSWSAQLRAALISAEADGRTATEVLGDLVSPDG